ncbi:MAG: preprotein translocase subunit SecG [Chromatiales bacterium]|nr:preprotein translocase subunit SecG [Chromatiales bacterium]
MQTILTVFHIFLAVGVVGLILIQHGKGADMGAAFGSGASGTVFGSKGSASFLTRATAILATLFFVTSMVMAYFAAQTNEPEGLMENMGTAPVIEAPAPESDLPAVPGGSSDLPSVPAADSVPQVQSEEMPPVQTSESATASEVMAEPSQEAAADEQQPAAPTAVDGK